MPMLSTISNNHGYSANQALRPCFLCHKKTGNKIMSVDATRWAWIQQIKSTEKIILLSLADRAGENHQCFPSIKRLELDTCLNRKTIIKCLAILETNGFITDTGSRKGITQGVKVWLLAVDEDRIEVPKAVPLNKQYQKRNGTENGTPSGPTFTTEAVPFLPVSGPKNGTQNLTGTYQLEPNIEPNSLRVDKSSADQELCREIWSHYKNAYFNRYGTDPVRNAKVNKQVRDLLGRLGHEAKFVAEYYVYINDASLIKLCHDIGKLLAHAETYRTQWFTGKQITTTVANQMDRTNANVQAVAAAAEIIKAKHAARGIINDQ